MNGETQLMPLMPREHEIKVWPQFFNPIRSGDKLFEIRWNDRNYAVGDRLWLREWEMPKNDSNHPNHVPGRYTGREMIAVITYVTLGKNKHPIVPGYCVIAIKVDEATRADGWKR